MKEQFNTLSFDMHMHKRLIYLLVILSSKNALTESGYCISEMCIHKTVAMKVLTISKFKVGLSCVAQMPKIQFTQIIFYKLPTICFDWFS